MEYVYFVEISQWTQEQTENEFIYLILFEYLFNYHTCTKRLTHKSFNLICKDSHFSNLSIRDVMNNCLLIRSNLGK